MKESHLALWGKSRIGLHLIRNPVAEFWDFDKLSTVATRTYIRVSFLYLLIRHSTRDCRSQIHCSYFQYCTAVLTSYLLCNRNGIAFFDDFHLFYPPFYLYHFGYYNNCITLYIICQFSTDYSCRFSYFYIFFYSNNHYNTKIITSKAI